MKRLLATTALLLSAGCATIPGGPSDPFPGSYAMSQEQAQTVIASTMAAHFAKPAEPLPAPAVGYAVTRWYLIEWFTTTVTVLPASGGRVTVDVDGSGPSLFPGLTTYLSFRPRLKAALDAGLYARGVDESR